jgi:hypothetical protein
MVEGFHGGSSAYLTGERCAAINVGASAAQSIRHMVV